MPMYEYACKKCHKHTEIIQKFSDTPLGHCPSCGGPMERLITPTAFVLKGGGWYKDGYTSKKGVSDTAKPTETKATCEQTGKPADASCACANATQK